MLFNRFKEQQHHKAQRESEARHKFVAELEASDKLAHYLQAAPNAVAAPTSSHAASKVGKPGVAHSARPHQAVRLDLAFVGPHKAHAVAVTTPQPVPTALKPATVRAIAPFARAVHNVEQEAEQLFSEVKEAIEEQLPVAEIALDRASLLLQSREAPAHIAVPARTSSEIYFRPVLTRSNTL